jgi:hypothetical protein
MLSVPFVTLKSLLVTKTSLYIDLACLILFNLACYRVDFRVPLCFTPVARDNTLKGVALRSERQKKCGNDVGFESG